MEILCRRILGFLLLLGIFVSPAWAAEPAGQVVAISGPFQAVNGDKETKTLNRGDDFYSGEKLMTGTNNTAYIRFSNGTLMALNPNTEFKIDEYVFKKNPKEDKSLLNLIKGGFRANAPGVNAIQTSVAVIGVHGANLSAALEQGKLYACAWKGDISIENKKGKINLGKNTKYHCALVKSKDLAPEGLTNSPEQIVGRWGVHKHAPHTNF